MVAQAVPTYAMSIFLLPLDLCKELEIMMNSFWWGSIDNPKKGIRWMAWKRLCFQKHKGGMGFRRLHEFNLAMLGKQSWRLLTQPNSLMARVFKAWYFPSTDFSTAQLGNNPSFVWRSIMAAKRFIVANCVWKVGDGLSIRVWHDPWLLDDTNTRITTPLIEGLENIKVNNLMKTGSREWDEDLIADLFNARDRQQILHIPLSNNSGKDKWVWGGERNGFYSVKSCYNMLCAPIEEHNSMVHFDWNDFWRIRTPPKAKNTMWRAVHNCLPTRERLISRGVNVVNMCPVCNNESETMIHYFFSCPFASRCWSLASIHFQVVETQTFADIISKRWQICSQEEKKLVIMNMWAIWKHRNEVLWTGKSKSETQMVNTASSFLLQWDSAQVLEARDWRLLKQDGAIKWTKPRPDWIKCNVDAAVFQNLKKAGYGCAFRNSNGDFVKGICGPLGDHSHSVMAEALSFREALSWIKIYFQNVRVILESDALVVIQAIRGRLVDNTYLNDVITDCISSLKDLSNVSCFFIRRSANCVAHELARASGSMSGVVEWDTNPPSFICSLLHQDLR